jgi:Domain of unknown function (DUF4190)
VTSDPNDPNRAFEYPSLEQSGVPVDPYAPIDYPPTYPSAPPAYPPSPQGYPPPFPSPYQPRYGTDPYYQYRVGHPHGTNGQAIGALVTAIVGVPLCFCAIPSIAAVILGIVAMNETRRTGQDGHGMALAAVVIGGITLAIAVVIWIASALTPNPS